MKAKSVAKPAAAPKAIRVLETVVSGKIVTAKVPAALLAHAGENKIYLESRGVSKIERSNMVVIYIVN
jgi:hypothetical protein